jgi:hypothetical protein
VRHGSRSQKSQCDRFQNDRFTHGCRHNDSCFSFTYRREPHAKDQYQPQYTSIMTSVFRSGALSSLEGRQSTSSNSQRSKASATGSINSYYKDGKLTAEGREQLRKVQTREVAKDSLVAKFENKFGKKVRSGLLLNELPLCFSTDPYFCILCIL